jgi:ferredoxin
VSYLLQHDELDALLTAIRGLGFRLIGPVARDGVICYDDIASAADLPAGWTDEQEAGTYRLRRSGDDALFGYTVGPQGWKRYLFPPRSRIWPPDRAGSAPPGPGAADGGAAAASDHAAGPGNAERFAFIGVRACELRAIEIQDRVFIGGAHPDPEYARRREGVFIVAVNCGKAGATCFCASAGSGPRAKAGFDIALTEFADARQFLLEAGTARGAAVVRGINCRAAPAEAEAAADAVTARVTASMGRSLPEGGADLRDLLYSNLDHSRWDDVASRCLSCGNCTLVCPTCFCFSVEDTSDLAGGDPQRSRSWDSCFTPDHSYLHGGGVRGAVRSRYRQWATHKLASWHDQFGTPGCVGCGRCITWCPVGIDITEEVAAIAADS